MSQNIVITGASRGIGLELCRQFQEEGHHVVAICREASEGLKELDVQILEHIDVSQNESIEQLKHHLELEQIDILINNAGVMARDNLDNLDFESLEQQMQVNCFGALRVIQATLDKLHAGSKVINITSRMGSIDDNTSGGIYGYRMSKSALNMATVSLAHDLKDREIAVGLIHPGFVRTHMTDGNGLLDPDESAEGIIELINELNLGNTGTFWHVNGEVLPW